MTARRRRILSELSLPLGPGASQLEAIEIAVAIEDGCGVTLPDEVMNPADLGRRESVESLLQALPGRA
ncbi:hypothetical protein LQF12_12970 [Ruania suaedae]|uniref:hypothetical protein n=1 Tax=Ruania suaedae TaxID=2897774 RepID=UPI001E4547E9|nr:hypothetical protein [Ruania suaedae]UFU02398.1 hypothetical protein LQF12_12970 [Ruania suaedae]